MDQLILKNNGNSPLYVNDLGIEVSVGEDFDLLQSFTAEDITESYDFPLVFSQGGQVTLISGAETFVMSLQDVLDYLTPLTRWSKIDYSYISGKDDTTNITSSELEELTDGSDTSLHTHDNRYYTETELQTPGSASVHWDNITNSPVGSITIINGDLYFRDATRNNKLLSAAECQYMWSESSINGQYMGIGDVQNADTGYLIPSDFTLTKVSVISAAGNATKQFEIRVNNNTVNTFNLIDNQYINTTLNIDLFAGDVLKMFVSGAGSSVRGAVAILYGKWRTV